MWIRKLDDSVQALGPRWRHTLTPPSPPPRARTYCRAHVRQRRRISSCQRVDPRAPRRHGGWGAGPKRRVVGFSMLDVFPAIACYDSIGTECETKESPEQQRRRHQKTGRLVRDGTGWPGDGRKVGGECGRGQKCGEQAARDVGCGNPIRWAQRHNKISASRVEVGGTLDATPGAPPPGARTSVSVCACYTVYHASRRKDRALEPAPAGLVAPSLFALSDGGRRAVGHSRVTRRILSSSTCT